MSENSLFIKSHFWGGCEEELDTVVAERLKFSASIINLSFRLLRRMNISSKFQVDRQKLQFSTSIWLLDQWVRSTIVMADCAVYCHASVNLVHHIDDYTVEKRTGTYLITYLLRKIDRWTDTHTTWLHSIAWQKPHWLSLWRGNISICMK